MKVLMTTDTLGGVWTYCIELCAALQEHGVSIALATMGRELSAKQQGQINCLPHVQLYESRYRLCWMEGAWADVERAGEWLLELERQLSPDVIHLNDLAHGRLPWQSPVLLVGHSCVFSWWEAVKRQPAPLEQWSRYHAVVRASIQNATLVVAPSHAMLVALLRHYGPAKASAVIPNGRDFPKLLPSPAEKKAHSEALIFAAGRVWDDAKNISALAAIAGSLPWPVYVAGEQTDPNGGAVAVEGVQCLGFLDNDALEHWLERATIYVAPAHYEPFGLSILEAARAGCALVLGNIKSLREIWGDAAEYVDPNNAQQLRQVICSLIDEPARLQQMIEQAWIRAQQFSATQMAADYLRCYGSLATGSTSFTPSSIPTLLGVRL